MEYNEKQIQIIQAAEKLFAADGFEGTSVRDIAHDAGVNIAMISYYFGSKEKLMEAIFAYRISYTRLTIESLLNSNTYTPIQKIEKIVDSYTEKLMANQCFYKLMTQEQSIREIHNISELIYDSKAKNLEMVKKIVLEGQKNGEFVKNIDVPLMMVTLIGTGMQFVISQDFYKKFYKMEDASDEEFKKVMKKKLNHHLKSLFKAFLTYDA